MNKLICKWAGVALLTVPLLMNACVVESSKPNMTTQQNTERKLVAGELIVNAVKDAEMLGVEMFADGMERPFYRKARSTYKNTDKMGFPLPRIPQQVRVIWRQKGIAAQIHWGSGAYYDSNGKEISRPGFIPAPLTTSEEVARRKEVSQSTGIAHYGPWASNYRDELAGDYTIPVASRIPASVFEEIERNGGALRIKFRLKPDGVMLGWDIQRMGKHLLQSHMPGGDFLDTEY